ncbi:MAG: serine/threonine protein kinase [Atribacterota bacterium]
MENKPNIKLLETSLEKVSDLCFINEGGFKTVYEAIIDGKKEALKVIFIPSENDDPEVNSEIALRVKREIESLSNCECPFLVKLGNLAPCSILIEGYNYLVYSEEFLEGETLLEQIRNRKRPNLKKCISLFICLLEVIRELKTKGLIHRDIKPGNVFALDDPNRAYVVLDLGIALKLHSTAITKNPEIRLGTLPYMAPEMFTPNFRDFLDYRSDLYSTAVTLYEYASGNHPIARKSVDDLTTMYRIVNKKPTPLNEYRTDLPKSLCQTIDSLLRKKPALRPSNLEELIRKMEAIL